MTVPLLRGPHVSRLISALPPVCAVALSIAAVARPPAGPHRRRSLTPLLANGGFEAPAIPANAFIRYGTGSTIGPWRVTQGNVDLTGANFWQAADGRQSLDLEGSESGDDRTAPRAPHRRLLHGDLRAGRQPGRRPDGEARLARVSQHTLGHPTVQKNFIFNTAGKSHGPTWATSRQRFRFRALSGSPRLTFASTTGGGYGPVIDAVYVTQSNPIECRLVRP